MGVFKGESGRSEGVSRASAGSGKRKVQKAGRGVWSEPIWVCSLVLIKVGLLVFPQRLGGQGPHLQMLAEQTVDSLGSLEFSQADTFMEASVSLGISLKLLETTSVCSSFYKPRSNLVRKRAQGRLARVWSGSKPSSYLNYPHNTP